MFVGQCGGHLEHIASFDTEVFAEGYRFKSTFNLIDAANSTIGHHTTLFLLFMVCMPLLDFLGDGYRQTRDILSKPNKKRADDRGWNVRGNP